MSPCFSQAPLQTLTDVCPAPVQSVLFISERSTSHSVGILRYLERTCAQLPPQLLSFVQGVLAAREEQKMDRPLCSYLKTIGVCRSLMNIWHQRFTGARLTILILFFIQRDTKGIRDQ